MQVGAYQGLFRTILLLTLAAHSCSKPHSKIPVSQVTQRKEESLKSASAYVAKQRALPLSATTPSEQATATKVAANLEQKLRTKMLNGGLSSQNMEKLSEVMSGHTKLYQFEGNYKILVIPVEFADQKFAQREFFTPGNNGVAPAQDYLFGSAESSLSTYYRHTSLGRLAVSGQVTEPILVDKNLAYYGEAVSGSSDKNARRLVVDALQKVKEQHTNASWWADFDNWDLSDYDTDKNFHEPDGFLDAVVLIYAGKSQASCQRSFDPAGLKPPTAEVPESPRRDATVECFNRIWPHRWSIALSSDDPLYSNEGPEIEGTVRPAMNGLKINDELFAFDYNMQSEFSDLSTFMHEFGHSLSLPDVYAYSGTNNTGGWEIMSSNVNLIGQEMSSFSKLSLGWIAPKVVKQGEKTSAYLGSWNFVPHEQRDDLADFQGPINYEQIVDGAYYSYDIVSLTPEHHEPVYRSLAVTTDPTVEMRKVVDFTAANGEKTLYSGRFDNESRSFKFDVAVPQDGDATLTFDTIYAIETETNFDSTEPEIRVVTDFDLGSVVIDSAVKEDLRLVSGDGNYDGLNESNPDCQVARVLELRSKRNSESGLSDEEKAELKSKLGICQAPLWVNKRYDLSSLRGRTVSVEIRLVADAGYNELGIVLDNIKLGEKLLFDFEGADSAKGQWAILGDQGNEAKTFNQLYLFEYRDPYDKFLGSNGPMSLNYDKGLSSFGNQSYFLPGSANLKEGFRALEFGYQPGVLVWYYNSRYSRRDNGSSIQDGKGYLLALNAHSKELPLPGAFADPALKDADGIYRPDAEPLKSFIAKQKLDFSCFSHFDYASYIDGVVPNCSQPDLNDAMQYASKDDRPLRFRREWFNNILPWERTTFEPVGEPFRNDETIRTGLSTFRPAGSEAFAPFKVYKLDGSRLVYDAAETADAAKFAPISQFSDALNAAQTDPRFKGDNVTVERKGFAFNVAKPNPRVVAAYDDQNDPSANNNANRKPRAKVIFDWK